MGKVATASTAEEEMKRKKKKGRPAETQIPEYAHRHPIILGSPPITYSRSHRRNPKIFQIPPPETGEDDDDDERKEKKVKLVGGLPQSDASAQIDQKQQPQKKEASHSRDQDAASASACASVSEPESSSGSEPETEDRDARAKKQKINAVDHGSDGAGSIQEKKDVKATDTQQNESPLESGPTSTLPDKKLLVFILDRLQKKDTYGVFSEPVDINELPDYFEVIDQPMDFGTVRKKLGKGAYKKLEELEADVYLICSNAMLYNAPDTVYYRQARSIQDIAKRDFENLRREGDNGEPQPKVVRRGRPPNNKNQKKSLEMSPLDRVGADPSSGAALTIAEDGGTGSNSYNLRKGPALHRYRSTDPYVSSYRPRNGENYGFSGDWNDEFPASILRADLKYSKKQFTVDENRRDTYRQFHPQSSANNSSVLTNSMGDTKQLMLVGLQDPLAYARSLARFAANLGPVAWKVASRRIEYVLPPGTQYGPGWVAENGATSSQPPSFSTQRQMPLNNPAAGNYRPSQLNSAVPHGISEEMVEAVRKLNSQNDRGSQGDVSAWKTPFPPVQQNHMYHHHQSQIQRNGFGGMLGFDPSAVGMARMPMPGHYAMEQSMNLMSRNELLSSYSSAMNHAVQEEAKLLVASTATPQREAEMWTFGKSSWPAMPARQSRSLSFPPDLNVRVPAGSPSSSLQIGSPQHQQQQQQQPDLALQL